MQYVDFAIPFKKEGYFSMRLKGIFVTQGKNPRTKKFKFVTRTYQKTSTRK